MSEFKCVGDRRQPHKFSVITGWERLEGSYPIGVTLEGETSA
jgi:hypothetical protein